MLKRGGNIFKRGLDRLGEYTLGELEKTYQGTVNKENMDKALKAGFNMIKNKVMKRGSSVSQKRLVQKAVKKEPRLAAQMNKTRPTGLKLTSYTL